MKKILIFWSVLVVISFSEKKEGVYRADPGTIALLAIVSGAAGTTLAVQGQRQQVKASKATAKYNAALAQQKADEERRVGQLRTEAKRKETKRILSSQIAGFSKAGVTLQGTPTSVLTETAKNEALNALLIGRESEITARGLESQSSLFSTQASNIGTAGRLAVGAELFGGVGSTITTATVAQSLKKK